MYPKYQRQRIAEELLLLVSTIAKFAEVYGIDLEERMVSAGYGEQYELYKQLYFPHNDTQV